MHILNSSRTAKTEKFWFWGAFLCFFRKLKATIQMLGYEFVGKLKKVNIDCKSVEIYNTNKRK